jgi:SAM-dependent methyltransferase
VIRAADRLAPPPPAVAHGAQPDRLFTIVRCAHCGLAFTDPRPTATAMDAYYPDAYHGVDAASAGAALEAWYRRRQHREAVRWLCRRRPRRGLLLDVGCGAGDLLCALRDAGWDVRGIEPGPAGVAAARRRGLAVEPGRFDVAAADGGAGDGPERYEVIVFSGVLEHLHDPLAALRRARGHLAPGGLVAVLHVPLFDSPEARTFGARWLALDLPRHLTHFERATVPRLAAAAGLGIESTEEYSRRHSAATLVSSLAPSLQKHRFYLDEGRRPAAAQAARKAAWLAAVTAARVPARLCASAGCGNHRSYFLAPRAG